MTTGRINQVTTFHELEKTSLVPWYSLKAFPGMEFIID